MNIRGKRLVHAKKLEVIVHSFYYEGGQTTIYRCQPEKIEEVLSVECGA